MQFEEFWVKFTMGLFEHPMANPSLANQLGSKVKCVLFFSLAVYFDEWLRPVLFYI